MLVREGLATSVAAAMLMLFGCSSSNPRDISYGTDAGADFTPPDGGSPKDVEVEESGASVDENGGEVRVDELEDAADLELDASIDGNP